MNRKVVIITGSSSGIGKATTQYFAKQWRDVIATMRKPEDAKDLQKENIHIYAMDVTNPEIVGQTISDVINKFGRIDALVNNAGYGLLWPIETATEEQIYKQYNTNVFGPIRTIQAIIPQFRKQESWVVVNVTSIWWLVWFPMSSLYNGTKFAMEGITQALSLELAWFGIKVKSVAPGGVKTNFNGRSMDMTEIKDPKYAELAQKVQAVFTTENPDRASADDVAAIIYTAVTDNTDQIRYIAWWDANAMYNGVCNMTNEEFSKIVKERFGI